jgi:hypothetical protein
MRIVRFARGRIVLFTIVAVMLVPWMAHAARTIQVPGDVPTVQGAIAAASDGDTVLVAPGTYRENLVLSKTITLASHYHTTGDRGYIDQSILDGGGRSAVITIPPGLGPATAVIGFTIRRGDNGIAPRSQFQLLNNRIVENTDGVDYESGSGGVARGNVVENNRDDGLDLDGTVALVIEYNVIQNNGDDGIEVRLHDYTGPTIEIVIRNNFISGNREDGIQLIDYAGISSRVFRIDENLIHANAMAALGMMADGNTVEDFSGAPLPEPVFLTNNTIVGNPYGVTGGANVTARNNIAVGATGIAFKNVGGNSSISHNLFWNNAVNSQASNVDGGTAVLADPLFDATYNLLPGSPAIEAGTNVGLPYNGRAPNLGAYRSSGAVSPRQRLVAEASPDRGGSPGSALTFTGNASGGTSPYSFAWDFGDGQSTSGMGMLIGDAGSHSISIHHNLFAHNESRNPAIKTSGTVDFVNNVIHNYGDSAGWVADEHARVPLNFVGNFYQSGPDSDPVRWELEVYEGYDTGHGFSLHVRDNIGPHRPTGMEPEDAVVSPNGRAYMVASPNPAPPITTYYARDAFVAVLDGAGAILPTRDAVDQRVVNAVRTRAGAIIDTPSQVGDWPELPSGAAAPDSDGDGMPDDWERAHGLDPAKDDSAGDRDEDGYTNVEEYLNGL